jgi:uncharacterized membrane protein
MESNHPADPLHPMQAGDAPALQMLIKRNCSMSPRGVLWLLAATAAVCFSIGALFAWRGLWLVLPFAGLEIATLAFAFYVSGLHAGDYERYWIEPGWLVVEVRDGRRVSCHRFRAAWARVVLNETMRDVRVALAEGCSPGS